MTNEPRTRVSPRTSPLELRLYVAALLAVVYTISWRAIGAHAPAAEPAVELLPTTSETPRVVWIDQLPPSIQPVITPPPGWQRAPERPPAIAPAERLVQVPSRVRVRTRSS